MERNRIRTRNALILIAVIIVCLLIGYSAGIYTTIKAVVYIAKPFISIDYQMVDDAIFKYKNNIGHTYYNCSK